MVCDIPVAAQNIKLSQCRIWQSLQQLPKKTQEKVEIPQNQTYEEYDHLGREILRKCSKGR